MASPEIAAMQMAKVTNITLMMPKAVTAHVGKSICSGLHLKPDKDRTQSFEKAWGAIRHFVNKTFSIYHVETFENICENTSSSFAQTL